MASKPQPPAAAVSVDSRVSSSTVESAVNALLKYKAAHSATEKLQLLPQDDYIYLNLTLKKIPNPHDRPQTTTPPSEQIKKLIKSQNIPISKVIKISKLKTDYKPYEAKRKLCDSYDLFLVDKRVVHLLPKLIGKQFFKKKKLPLGWDLRKSNLKLQVERALGSALLYLRTGTCCVMKVGKVAMEKDEVVENVIDAIKGAVERVPKKWDGVRSLHLKFYDSVALPIYQAMPDVKLKIEGLKEIEKRAELAKISDSEGEVKETSGRKDGKSGKKKKGRIHEVRYMDVGEDMESGDDVDEIEQVRSEDNDDGLAQKMKGNLMVESDDDEEDKDERTLNGEKRVKKKPKSEKSGDEKVKKDDVSGGEVSGGKKGKKKSELGQRRSERIAKVKDGKPKKKVSAK
ncbi:UNVERIFIED_CONTAM: Ribosomal L1 domain-containing protein 1 [Sesamum radiatum]|uniref:Ribosomal L1 domain-containing protein 1 n=1 Tax=Sesamum radiatum TaxID=300843 RepID=A0AAW2KL81_SESRA